MPATGAHPWSPPTGRGRFATTADRRFARRCDIASRPLLTKRSAEPKLGNQLALPSASEADPASTEGEAQLGPRLFRELHNTVGWKPVVSSKRLTRRPTYAKAEIHRRSREAKGEWKVVPSTSNIAKR